MTASLLQIDDPETDDSVEKSHLGFPVVGIGASAGGIAALQRLFENMPATTGMAFVVVVHLSPTHSSSLDTILQRSTKMPVLQVNATLPIEANHIYLISPSNELSMTDGQLRVRKMVRSEPRHTSIDLFFRSLAEAHRERSVCIILSGTGSDGTQGLKRVKELGGVSIVQAPDDAEYDGMPRSAIAAGLVDAVLPAVEMPQRLIDLWSNARIIELPKAPSNLEARDPAGPIEEQRAEHALVHIKSLLRNRTGHDFTHYKRATVLRRLERRMQVNGVSTLPAYLRFLESHVDETPLLLQDMLISVTNFFRDREAFESLERVLMSDLESHPKNEPVRAWVVGCATGEEAYSIAMLLCEHLGDDNERSIQVFASDIDQRAIAVGRAGLYPSSIVTDVAPTRLRRYFAEEQGQYRVVKSLRDKVIFSAHNGLRDPPFTRLDLVCCRNLLIYLDRAAQLQLLQTFNFALHPGGLLFLGNSESADAAEQSFAVVDKKQRLYRGSGSQRSMRFAPSMAVPTVEPLLLPLRPPAVAKPPLEELHQRLDMEFGPPTVLIDLEENVLHLHQRAAHLLRIAGGAPSTKLLALVRPEIRIELRTALFRAVELGRKVHARPVQYQANGALRYLAMSVQPVRDDASGPCMLIVFDEAEESLDADATPGAANDPIVAALEDELHRTTARLAGSLGESATSTEELRSSNEELQSINEELRSATEELETGKEELQSVNEELITVNQELSNKVEETAKVNDDLQNLIASTDIATLFVDKSIRIKRYTPPSTNLFNIIPSDLGRSLLDITHRLDYPELADDVTETLKSLRQREREVGSADGRWFLVRLLPYRTSEDRIDGAVLNFIDVSARRAAEEQLRSNEQRLRMVADSTRDYSIVTFDVDGRITTWNAGAERMFGYLANEVIGQLGDLIFTPEDRDNGVPADEFRRARDDGRAEDDRWHLRKNGERFFCSGIMTPLIDGGLRGYAKIARDLTQSKLLDTQREALFDAEKAIRERLEGASVMKDEFLAVMSHELKNPLNLIQMNAELLLRMPQARNIPSVARAAGIIRQTVASQAQIIDDLLDLSRLNTGKFELNPAPVALKPVIERIVGAVQADARTKKQMVSLDVRDGIMVYADQIRVEQIVWNLVSNAQKFTPQGGGISVTAAVEEGWAVLRVTDTGEGMEQPFLSQVFEMFRQADSGISRQRGGLGIGLALVKRLVDLHGGSVSASSPGLGLGATFRVSLPLYESAEDMQPPAREAAATAGIFDGLRVLVVDDDMDVLEIFSTVLEVEGAQVVAAENGAKALELATAESFGLIISDLSMPVMDGYALAERLRQLPKTRETPMIALSGMARAGDQERAASAGFDAHFAKPVELDHLLAEVKRLVARPGRTQ